MKIKYLAIEGNEGTGKTLLSRAVAQKIGAFYTYEPNAEIAELKQLRKLALSADAKMTTYGRELILLASRSIHLDLQIKPLIALNKKVLTDRSFLSGMVYANYHGIKFSEWLDLSLKCNIDLFPEAIVYVTTDKRKIDKVEGDIYDNAGEDNLKEIDMLFNRAIDFLYNHFEIPIIKFKNYFNRPIQRNADNLLNLLNRNGITI